MVDALASLRADHRNMKKLFNAFERQLAIFDRAEHPDYELLEAVVEYCVGYPDQVHHRKEDLVLHRMSERDEESAARIGDLEAEHRKLAETTRRFETALDNVLNEAEMPRESIDRLARDFLTQYRDHIDWEERVFFPLAEQTLTETDHQAIENQVTVMEDPLFGVKTEARFVELRNDILRWAEEDAR